MLNANRGLTLLELLIAISIAALLATVAIPSMHALIADARLGSAITAMSTMLTRARSEAIDRNLHITLCPTVDGTRCAEANQWNRGVMLFHDSDGNRRRNDDESLIKYHPMNSAVTIFSGATPSSTGRSRKRVVFMPSGSAGGSTISIRFCPGNDETTAMVLIVQNSGRIRLSERDGSGRRPACDS